MKVFIIQSEHHHDGDWSSLQVVCRSLERAERWLEENGWTRLPKKVADFNWGKPYMDDELDVSTFDVSNGWEGAVIIPMDVEE